MTARTPLQSAHGKPCLQMSSRYGAFPQSSACEITFPSSKRAARCRKRVRVGSVAWQKPRHNFLRFLMHLLAGLVPQLTTEVFAGSRLGQFLHNLDAPWIFVIRHALLTKIYQLFRGHVLNPALQSDKRHDGFTAIRIGLADHGGLTNGWMLVEDIFNLARPHLVPGGDDHILLAINDIEPALFVHLRNIPGVEIAITDSICRLFRFLPVASDDLRPLRNQLSHLAWRNVLSCCHIHYTTDRIGNGHANRQRS